MAKLRTCGWADCKTTFPRVGNRRYCSAPCRHAARRAQNCRAQRRRRLRFFLQGLADGALLVKLSVGMVHFPKRVIPRPDRVRRINGSFAWIDHRFLRDGHIERLALEDMGVYLFLLVAGDRNGASWYRIEKIGRPLGLYEDQVVRARERLVERELVAFEPFRPGDINGFCQVLPIPERSDV